MTYTSIPPLRMYLKHHPNSQVLITGSEMGERKTRINPNAEEQAVRFITPRRITMVGVNGD